MNDIVTLDIRSPVCVLCNFTVNLINHNYPRHKVPGHDFVCITQVDEVHAAVYGKAQGPHQVAVVIVAVLMLGSDAYLNIVPAQ